MTCAAATAKRKGMHLSVRPKQIYAEKRGRNHLFRPLFSSLILWKTDANATTDRPPFGIHQSFAVKQKPPFERNTAIGIGR